MDGQWIALLMFLSMLMLLVTGQRMFGVIGVVAVVAAMLLWGDRGAMTSPSPDAEGHVLVAAADAAHVHLHGLHHGRNADGG